MKMLLGASLVLALMHISSCGLLPEKVKITDPKVQPMLEAAAVFDREAFGFSPIPTEGNVAIETSMNSEYDVMLHFGTETTSRTIAFRKTDGGYKWIGEQELFFGPNKYTDADGTATEHISLTYDIEKISGFSLDSLWIDYWGEDPRLTSVHSDSFSLEIVQPILKEWGY